jgi:hypothetical protein
MLARAFEFWHSSGMTDDLHLFKSLVLQGFLKLPGQDSNLNKENQNQ